MPDDSSKRKQPNDRSQGRFARCPKRHAAGALGVLEHRREGEDAKRISAGVGGCWSRTAWMMSGSGRMSNVLVRGDLTRQDYCGEQGAGGAVGETELSGRHGSAAIGESRTE